VPPTAADWTALQGALTGPVVLPDAAAYDAARRPAVANFHGVRPRAVARCAAAHDVAEVLAFARRFALPVAVRSGGHCFAGRSSTTGIVLDVAPMHAVTVDGDRATIGAGARLRQVYDALGRHGRTIPAGCGPEVGIAGLTLGGGLGVLGRRDGLTCDRLAAAEVVLADGRIVACDDERHEDLFWALRGAGGGRFGVVTRLTFRTVPEPDTTATFDLVWPHTGAVVLIDAWQDWAPAAPDELAASLLVTASADPAEPPLVHVFGAMAGGRAGAERLLDELVRRSGADPASAAWTEQRHHEAKRHLAEHGPGDDRPGLISGKSGFFRRALPADAIAALAANLAAGRAAGESRVLDFTPWGGAYGRVDAGATAFAHRDARFLLKHDVLVGLDAPAAAQDAARAWAVRSWAAVEPWGTGGVYANFPDPDLRDWSAAYHGGNLDRLRRVKARYDPGGVLGADEASQRHRLM